MTKEEIQKLRETAERVRTKNASVKRGHPRYTANLTSAEEMELTNGCIAILSALDRAKQLAREACSLADDMACDGHRDDLFINKRGPLARIREIQEELDQ